MEVLPSDGGDAAITVHETVLLLHTTHAADETEGEVDFDCGVIVQERSSLGGEGGNVAPDVLAGEVSAGKLGEPELVAGEGRGEGVDVGLEVAERAAVPMESQGIWQLIATELAQPLLHPGDTIGSRGGGGRDDVVALVLAEREHELPPPSGTSSGINVGLTGLVDPERKEMRMGS